MDTPVGGVAETKTSEQFGSQQGHVVPTLFEQNFVRQTGAKLPTFFGQDLLGCPGWKVGKLLIRISWVISPQYTPFVNIG